METHRMINRPEALTAMHEATRELMGARSVSAVTDIAAETARDVLGKTYSTVFLYDEDAGVLEPVTTTSASAAEFGTPPTFEPGQGITGEVFATGEYAHVADASEDPRAHPEGSDRIRGYVAVPIGEYGVLTFASRDRDAYDEADVELARILAANTEAALGRAERERELECKRAELERKNERLDEFVGMVSHDLRNPLNVAIGHLELIREDHGDGEHVAAVARAHDRMRTLIDDLLVLAREGDGVDAVEPLRLSSAARHAWENVDTGEARLRIVDDRSIPADRSRLSRAFENLFRNSVEHGTTSNRTESGDDAEHGSTATRARSGDAAEHDSASGTPASDDSDPITVTVGGLADGFYVADDGVGFDGVDTDRLFDAGYTTGSSGPGLGLSIVNDVVDAHGWTITATDDDGARFEIRGIGSD